MKTRNKILFDWIVLFVFCSIIYLTMDMLPTVWNILQSSVGVNVVYIPRIFVGSVLLFLFFYLLIFRKHRVLSSYLWFAGLTVILGVMYGSIGNPYDKMHLFEYFIMSFLFFKALRHHLFTTKLYFLGAIFAMIMALTDETFQFFTAERTFSLGDIGADFVAATLGQIAIALIIRPKLEVWRPMLRRSQRHLRAQEEWLKRRK